MAGIAAAPPATDRKWRRRLRPVVGFLTVLLILLVVWEVLKALGGDRWKADSLLGTGLSVDCLACHWHVVLDVGELVRKHGPNQSLLESPVLHTKVRWRI